jgi:hypothetical protein
MGRRPRWSRKLGGHRLSGLKEEVMEFLAEFELNVKRPW